MQSHSKKARKLRQLFNHANVLHNLAWEAKFSLNNEIDRIMLKCKTKAEFNKRMEEFEELFKCKLWEFPSNPKPKRDYSHSGDISPYGIHTWQFGCKKGWTS